MLDLRSLGSVDLRRADGVAVHAVLSQPKRLALLIYLAAARPPDFHRRDALLPLFWPDSDEEHARKALNQALHYLRGHLPRGTLRTRGREDVGVAPAGVSCDLRRLHEAVTRQDWAHAVAEYEGPFLEGFHAAGAAGFERWAELERARARDAAAAAGWELARARLTAGRLQEAEDVARWALDLVPTDEGPVGAFVEQLASAGERVAGLRLLDRLERRLAADFDLDASPELEQVAARVRHGPPEGGRRARGEAAFRGDAPSEPPRAVRGLRRRGAAVAALAGLAVLVVAGVVVHRRGDGASPVAEAETFEDRVLVAPFEYRGPDPDAYLAEALTFLVSQGLDGAGPLRTVDTRAVLSAVRSAEGPTAPAAAIGLARRFGAGRVVMGSLVDTEGRLWAEAALYDSRQPGRAPLRVAREDSGGDPIRLADDLVRGLLVSIVEGAADYPSRVPSLALTSTASLDALKAFLEGEHMLRRAELDTAAERFAEAVRLDTTFALAYFRLGVAVARGGQAPIEPNAFALALRHKDRLPEQERTLLEAYWKFLYGRDAEEAERLGRMVVARNPTHLQAWELLAAVLFHHGARSGRSLDESRDAARRVRELDSNAPDALARLGWIAVLEEDRAGLDSLVRALETTAPRYAWLLQRRGMLLFPGGKPAEQEAFLAEAAREGLVARTGAFWGVLWFEDDPERARRSIDRLTADGNGRYGGARALAGYALSRGRWTDIEQAYARYRAASPGAPPSMGAMALGLPIQLPPAFLDQLEADLRPATGSEPRLRAALRHYVQGLVAIQRRDTAGVRTRIRYLDELAASREPIHLPVGNGGPDWAYTYRVGDMARDLSLSLDARQELPSNPQRALDLLDRARPQDWWNPEIFGATVFNWTNERFLRAELLWRLGRHDEARLWFEGLVVDPSSLPYRPVKHLRLAEIHEAGRRPDRAAWHFGRVITLLDECDEEWRPLKEAAAEGLRRVGRERFRPDSTP